MSRIDLARLDDIADVLQQVRSWDGVEDRGGGTFYLKRKPYLHFHVGQDSRRADIRRFDGWVQFDLPEPLPAGLKQEFLVLLEDEYAGR
ncbi:MAG TPA: hypothetical protein VFZ97_01900 [Acidimicrobiales bacterium]